MEKTIINSENTEIYTVSEDKKLILLKDKEFRYKTNEKYMRLEFMRDFSAFRDIDLLSKDHKVIINIKINDSKKEIFVIFLMSELKKSGVKIINDLLKDNDFKIKLQEKINLISNENTEVYKIVESLITQN